MENLVSVCIPVYNGEKYLKECICSVLAQSHLNIEILVVDDGSVDSSLRIIRQLQENDQRIRVIVNEKNNGLVGNWKKCIDSARGEWIKFLFQDDIMQPNCVEKMLNICKQFNSKIGICSREFIIEDSASPFLKDYLEGVYKLENVFPEISKLTPYKIVEIAKDKLFQNFIGEPITLLFHKSLMKAYGGFNADLVQLVDYEFALRVCLNTDSIFIPECLVKFRVHSTSASSNQSNTDIKLVKSQFIEPLVMYHEYIFNHLFFMLKKEYGAFKMLKSATLFYFHNHKKYIIPKELKQSLYSKYKGLYLIRLLAFYGLLKIKTKKIFLLKFY